MHKFYKFKVRTYFLGQKINVNVIKKVNRRVIFERNFLKEICVSIGFLKNPSIVEVQPAKCFLKNKFRY